MKNDHGDRFYDGPDPQTRIPIDLDNYPLTLEDGQENPIYNSSGIRIPRRNPIIDEDISLCGVLVDLTNIQALFNPQSITDPDSVVHVNAYPLGFLRTAGNIQANGIPHSFYPFLTRINKSVRKHQSRYSSSSDRGSHDHENDLDEDDMLVDDPSDIPSPSLQVVKPICSQFYNYITHRVAACARRHDSQQGTVTAAIAGAFAIFKKDKVTAAKMKTYCDHGLPS